MFSPGWTVHFDLGLRMMARHRPADAVRHLQRALERCPASRPADLSRVCFYLGVALRRIGYSQSAIRSWTTSQRLNKRGPTRKMLARQTNCYGMDRQPTAEADDWLAFYSVQAARYLLCKNKRMFSTDAERDMIGDLIRDSWAELARSGRAEGLDGAGKMKLFKAVRIVFPTVVVPEAQPDGPIIGVDFRSKRKISLDDRCPCGSGMSYMHCCGRIPGREELFTGVF